MKRLSISKIRAFKACRRFYQLKYVENLVPVKKPEVLENGSNYHKLLEELHNTGNLDLHDGEFTKELAMARAYEKYVYPKMHIIASEKWTEYDMDDVKFVGIVDAISDDGHIVEHKTTGSEITEEYEYNLLWDEQILAYMLMTGARKIWYTVCRKPTIRKKQTETDEEFFKRMVAWYDVDTDSKIRLLEIERTDDEVEAFRKDLEVIKGTIQEAEEDRNFYRNACHCNSWGRRCEYSSVCLHYDPTQNYIEFERR